MTIRLTLSLGLAFSLMAFPATALRAESLFGMAMKEKYDLRTVSCNTCHVKGEEKEVLNDFGKDYQKLTQGKEFGARIAAAKEKESEERKELNEKMKEELIELMKKLDEMKAPSGKTYAEAIAAGEIEGIKLRD